jgi:hypothetical protein
MRGGLRHVKPLPENHFTPEDWDVMIDVVLRCGRIVDGSMFGYWVMERSRQSDRRDAVLMHGIEAVRANMTFAVEHVWYMLLKGYLYIDALGDFKVRE